MQPQISPGRENCPVAAAIVMPKSKKGNINVINIGMLITSDMNRINRRGSSIFLRLFLESLSFFMPTLYHTFPQNRARCGKILESVKIE